MNTDLLAKVESKFLKKDLPNVAVGDTVEILTIVRDRKKGVEKTRKQPFKGLVIAMRGSGLRTTLTVRKISSGVGVERILPLHSPNIDKIEILKKGKVRQANIFYMRERVGKKAMKVKQSDEEIIIPQEIVSEEVTDEPEQEVPVEETKA